MSKAPRGRSKEQRSSSPELRERERVRGDKDPKERSSGREKERGKERARSSHKVDRSRSRSRSRDVARRDKDKRDREKEASRRNRDRPDRGGRRSLVLTCTARVVLLHPIWVKYLVSRRACCGPSPARCPSRAAWSLNDSQAVLDLRFRGAFAINRAVGALPPPASLLYCECMSCRVKWDVAAFSISPNATWSMPQGVQGRQTSSFLGRHFFA